MARPPTRKWTIPWALAMALASASCTDHESPPPAPDAEETLATVDIGLAEVADFQLDALDVGPLAELVDGAVRGPTRSNAEMLELEMAITRVDDDASYFHALCRLTRSTDARVRRVVSTQLARSCPVAVASVGRVVERCLYRTMKSDGAPIRHAVLYSLSPHDTVFVRRILLALSSSDEVDPLDPGLRTFGEMAGDVIASRGGSRTWRCSDAGFVPREAMEWVMDATAKSGVQRLPDARIGEVARIPLDVSGRDFVLELHATDRGVAELASSGRPTETLAVKARVLFGPEFDEVTMFGAGLLPPCGWYGTIVEQVDLELRIWVRAFGSDGVRAWMYRGNRPEFDAASAVLSRGLSAVGAPDHGHPGRGEHGRDHHHGD